MKTTLSAALCLATALTLAGCGGSTQQAATPSSAAPTPDQELLTQAHTEQWPAPDDKILQLAHQQCPPPGQPAESTNLAVSWVVLETKFTQQQAQSFVYTARRLYCPEVVGS